MTAYTTRFRILTTAMLMLGLGTIASAASDRMPWKTQSNAIVIDAYELNIIDWDKMLSDSRIAGFISKASDGLPESYNCAPGHGGDTIGHCRTMWRKYAVSRELYQTRRALAKAKGLFWGAYHLARPGNPIDQANHFLDFADPADDEMMVLDLEDLDERFMSLADAEIFANHVKARTGRYPVLYTNHNTAEAIAAARDVYKTLSRLPLWYARYKPDISGVFPLGNWENYALWQFATMHNCGPRKCPYRVPGTLTDIDVNVAPMTKAELKEVWSRGELVPERPAPVEPGTALVATAVQVRQSELVVTASVSAASAASNFVATEQKADPLPTETQVRLVPVASSTGQKVASKSPSRKSRKKSARASRLKKIDPTRELAFVPVPVPSPRWIDPMEVGFAAVATPVMPAEGPLFDMPETRAANSGDAPDVTAVDMMPTGSIGKKRQRPRNDILTLMQVEFPAMPAEGPRIDLTGAEQGIPGTEAAGDPML